MIDLLLENTIVLFSSSFGESLNWIGRVIQWIIDLAGNVGVGIILFTLALKLITLPLDIYSKASMRKNSLKMEKMRPQLEKLQKQYQNDQQVYNQKMMELYKKNGYSMFGACLPMIVTLVLFIIVLGAFDDYSNYMNVEVYRQMAQQYNAAITQYAPELTDAEGNVTGEVSYIANESQTDAANGKFAYDRVIGYAAEENADTGLLAVRIIRTVVSDTQLDANNTEQMAALFENIEKLGLSAGFLRAGGKIVAFSAGEVCGDTMFVHVEKALRGYPGAYPAMAQAFAQAFCGENVRYINREDDSGDMGLRKSKLQYLPAALLDKYNIAVKRTFDSLSELPVIHTERLVLKEVADEDAAAFAAMDKDDELNRYWGANWRDYAPKNPSDKWFLKDIRSDFKKKRELPLGIYFENALVGEVVLHRFGYQSEAEIGMRVMRPWQGRGFAREALLGLMEYGFCKLGLERIEACAYKENAPSVYALKSAGMRPCGEDNEKQYFYKTAGM